MPLSDPLERIHPFCNRWPAGRISYEIRYNGVARLVEGLIKRQRFFLEHSEQVAKLPRWMVRYICFLPDRRACSSLGIWIVKVTAISGGTVITMAV